MIELQTLRLPAGDLRRYDASLEAQSTTPSVPLENALARVGSQEFNEMSLVHVPVYTFRYEFGGQTYTSLVEAASGGVMAHRYPAKAEVPYQLVGIVTALIFLCLSTFPIIGGLASGVEGLTIGFFLCGALGVVAAPLLFAWAMWVASKI